jgi:molybdopterin-guanine dinucleotide biosynthesis protein A
VRRLGAIIAGGKATRFGSDKAAAVLNGRPLIEHVADGLRKQVDKIIVCGRAWPGMDSVDDAPFADMGPLGGLNAALIYAQQNVFDAVVTAGCDVVPVPELPRNLPDGRAVYIDGHYLFGVWPVALAPVLDRHLRNQDNLSMRSWITLTGAQAIMSSDIFHNLNTPLELAQYAAQQSQIGIR